jgi:uncharacterized protein
MNHAPDALGATQSMIRRASPPGFAPIDRTKSVTFVVTEDCNLRCDYCYLSNKNSDHRMPFEVARAAIDYLVLHPNLFAEPCAVWDFIGGEPFLELPLIERIVEYVLLRTYELDHPWFTESQFAITTNGLLYQSPTVQRFIERYHDVLEVTVSVDGPARIHDRVRKTVDGKGSYARVSSIIPLWLKQFPRAATKVTLSHDNLGDVAESILHLFELGIKQVNANVVFENVWKPGDDLVFEEQLDCLGREILKRGLWNTHSCSLFLRDIGTPLDLHNDNVNWCGSGRMLAVDSFGNFYPCVRFLPFSLSKRAARTIGNIHDGLALNRARPFLALTTAAQSSAQCVQCEVARGCAWCQGLNYDEATTDTIYQRATFLCLMHKARVRANARFWRQLDASVNKEDAWKA